MKHIKKERWERQADFGHKLLKEEYIRKYLEKKNQNQKVK